MLYNKDLSPQGVEDLYGDEYQIKNEVIKKMENVFNSFGYKHIMTPTIEYYYLYSELEDSLSKDQMFKLIDRDGKILVLRPDATIPVARMAGANYKYTKEHLKFSYVTNIFRLSSQKNGEKREFVQGGVEYLGNDKPDCDGEVIAMAIKCLMKCGLKNFHIDLGQVKFLDSLINELNIDKGKKKQLYSLIENKNYGDLRVFLDQTDMLSKYKEILIKIPKLYGKPEKVMLTAKSLVINREMEEALCNLKDVYNILKHYGLEEYIFFDLGFTKSLGYYTGMIFKGYANSFGEVVLSGGRYDELTKHFGTPKPACGFGLNLNKLIEVMEMLNIEKKSENFTDYLILYKDAFRGRAIKLAENLRDKGFVVEADLSQLSIRDYMERARDTNTREILEIDKDYVKVVSISQNQINRLSINQFIKSLESQKMLASIH